MERIELDLPQSELYLMTELVRRRERDLSERLHEAGFSLHEWRVLRILYSFSSDVPMSALIEHSQTDRTALGRTIDRLEKRSLVLKLPSPADKRAVFLRLLPGTDEPFARALKLVTEYDGHFLASLDEHHKSELTHALKTLASALDL